jgi:hypothetical protein
MTLSEMELVRQLGEVAPLPGEAYDQARALLQAAIAVDSAAALPEHARRTRRRRRVVLVRSGLTAGVAATAAAAVLIAGAPKPAPKAPATPRPVASSVVPAALGPAALKPIASPLMRLADSVSAMAAPTGNATLVARTTALGGGKSVTVYDLYGDDGRYFFSQTESGLPQQVSGGHDQAGGLFAREVAAAKLAATGDLQTAGEDMAAAPDPGKFVPPIKTQTLSAADASKEPGVYHAGEVIGTAYDNYLWENSQDALIAGAGDPQVRAGVLRLITTLPDVTVTSGTSADQPTLVLNAGTDEAGDIEQIVINAITGIPISAGNGAPGQAVTTKVTYQVSRVTTSDIAAGKF